MGHICHILTLVVLTFLSSFLPIPLSKQVTALSSPYAIVRVDPDSTTATVGQTFAINITVNNVGNLYAFEVDLYWNASVLEAISIDVRADKSDGVLYTPIFIAVNDLSAGKYVLAMTSTSSNSFNGSGRVVWIAFSMIGTGYSGLNLESLLYDYRPGEESQEIPHSTIDGVVDVVPELPEIAVVPLLIVLTIVVINVRKFSKQTEHEP